MKHYKRESHSDINPLTLCEETLESIFAVVRCGFTWLPCGCLTGSPVFPSTAFIVSVVMQNYLSQLKCKEVLPVRRAHGV